MTCRGQRCRLRPANNGVQNMPRGSEDICGSAVNAVTDPATLNTFQVVRNAIIVDVVRVWSKLRGQKLYLHQLSGHNCSALFSGQSSTRIGAAIQKSLTNPLSLQGLFAETFHVWKSNRH